MIEQWRDIKGYEGKYQVSNTGKVRSLDHIALKRHPKGMITSFPYPGKELLPRKVNGYLQVKLYDEEGVRHFWKVHRLVAMAFVPGYKEGLQVNHKDENPLNNRADNLEWCTATYNNNYGHHLENVSKAQGRAVAQMTKEGETVNTFRSIAEAERRTGINATTITKVCRHLEGSYTAGGYRWEYADSNWLTTSEVDARKRKGIETGARKRGKRIKMYSKDGEPLRTFDTIGEAERATGILRQGISRACRKGGTAGGYIWKYE